MVQRVHIGLRSTNMFHLHIVLIMVSHYVHELTGSNVEDLCSVFKLCVPSQRKVMVLCIRNNQRYVQVLPVLKIKGVTNF